MNGGDPLISQAGAHPSPHLAGSQMSPDIQWDQVGYFLLLIYYVSIFSRFSSISMDKCKKMDFIIFWNLYQLSSRKNLHILIRNDIFTRKYSEENRIFTQKTIVFYLKIIHF